MLKIRYWIKDFFGFPRSQVNGFLILSALLILFMFSEPAWHWWVANRNRDLRPDRALLDSLISFWNTTSIDTTSSLPLEPFEFDPNKSTEDQFIALGFSRPLASRIIRYREKGGKFRTKSDVLKIYGIDTAFYQRIHSFIRLPEVVQARPKTLKNFKLKPFIEPPEKRLIFDLNKADTSALKTIKGIGEKLSLRIVKYRDVLGGFLSTDQLNDVYGLDSLVIKRLVDASFIDDGFVPVKLDINRATEKELSAHPYINKMAKVIVSYRFQHGDFKSVEDIRSVLNLDEKKFQRIIPYFEVRQELE